MKIIKVAVSILLIVLLALSTVLGILFNYLFLLVVVSAVIAFVITIISIIRKKIAWDFSYVKSIKSYVLVGVFRNTTWILMGLCVHISMIPIQFSPGLFTANLIFLWGSVFILCVIEWLPWKRVGNSINIALLVFLGFLTLQLGMVYTSPQADNFTQLSSPLKGEWYVFQGGNSALINHHYYAGSQKYALDIIDPVDGQLSMNAGNKSFYFWRKHIW